MRNSDLISKFLDKIFILILTNKWINYVVIRTGQNYKVKLKNQMLQSLTIKEMDTVFLDQFP